MVVNIVLQSRSIYYEGITTHNILLLHNLHVSGIYHVSQVSTCRLLDILVS
jgi:hypothetical protein